jgi:D-glycero-D-manno-heptose 1,7-bisphosphate phosphatase
MLIWMSSPKARSRKFLFLDRDGVLNVDSPDYIKHWDEFHFYPDALDALRWLRHRDVNVILVSNQSALHRGLMSHDDFWQLHEQMIHHICEAGGDMLATFYCPHRPDERCSCRKPSPAMILAAARLYGAPMETSYLIGDRATDLQAARQAGCRSIMLERSTTGGPPQDSSTTDPMPMARERYTTLLEAVEAMWETDPRRFELRPPQ